MSCDLNINFKAILIVEKKKENFQVERHTSSPQRIQEASLGTINGELHGTCEGRHSSENSRKMSSGAEIEKLRPWAYECNAKLQVTSGRILLSVPTPDTRCGLH